MQGMWAGTEEFFWGEGGCAGPLPTWSSSSLPPSAPVGGGAAGLCLVPRRAPPLPSQDNPFWFKLIPQRRAQQGGGGRKGGSSGLGVSPHSVPAPLASHLLPSSHFRQLFCCAPRLLGTHLSARWKPPPSCLPWQPRAGATGPRRLAGWGCRRGREEEGQQDMAFISFTS